MKRIISIAFIINMLVCGIIQETLTIADKRETYSYILKLHNDRKRKLAEPIFAFYKGKPLELSTDCAVIPEKNKVPLFSIIITPDVTHDAEGNNVRYLRRKEEMPFAWYDLSLRSQVVGEDAEQVTKWDVKKLDAHEAPVQIPEHAIIIYFNPDLIENLEEVASTHVCKIDMHTSHVIPLPEITVRADAREEDIEAACIEAVLASLELRTLHKKNSVATKREQKTIMSLCKNL